MSRVYGGIHFKFSSTIGLQTGQQVGQWVLDQFNTTMDTIGPRIRLDAGLDLIDDELPVLTGAVTDNLSGVSRLSYTIDGGALKTAVVGPDGRFAIDLAADVPGAADGPVKIRLIAQDAAGNTTILDEVEFVLATTDPVITLAAESLQPNETIEAGERLTGNVALTDGNRLTALTYSIDGGPARQIGFDATTGAFDDLLDFRLTPAGDHSVTIRAIDAAGNETTQVINITVPALPFTVTDIGPEENSMAVGVTYRPYLEFSRAVDPATLTSASFYATDPTGAVIPARIVPFSDGLGAWLIFDDALPGSSAIKLHIDGTEIRSLDGAYLDAASTGTPSGSDYVDTFTTASTTSVPGTSITGIVLDPASTGR